MEGKRRGLSCIFALAGGEGGKLGAGMLLAVLCSVLSLVPYLIVYRILLLIIQSKLTYERMTVWACIGITTAILQAVLGSGASEEKVREAAKAAQIDEFIMSLPKAYQTRIGAEGVRLSGGQQQRISIARAILKDAPIVIFDEATSYADIENEHKIQIALQNLLKGKTTITIAHRLYTIRNADKIIVFQDGSVTEQGTHEELVKKDGVYSRMWDACTKSAFGKEEI